MIRVDGDLTSLLDKMTHHASALRPLALELAAQLLASPYAADDKIHRLSQRRGGPLSWSLLLADGREYHFRTNLGDYDEIVVYDRYRSRPGRDRVRLALLRTPQDARRFARSLVNPMTAAALRKAA